MKSIQTLWYVIPAIAPEYPSEYIHTYQRGWVETKTRLTCCLILIPSSFPSSSFLGIYFLFNLIWCHTHRYLATCWIYPWSFWSLSESVPGNLTIWRSWDLYARHHGYVLQGIYDSPFSKLFLNYNGNELKPFSAVTWWVHSNWLYHKKRWERGPVRYQNYACICAIWSFKRS